jgi:hypothetical protein
MTTIAKIQEFALPEERNVKTIMYAGLAVLAMLVSMYVYFVGKIVFDVVGRKTAETSIRGLQSSISANSMAYLGQMKTLDLATAESIGLSESHDTLYASRDANTGTALGMVYAH